MRIVRRIGVRNLKMLAVAELKRTRKILSRLRGGEMKSMLSMLAGGEKTLMLLHLVDIERKLLRLVDGEMMLMLSSLMGGEASLYIGGAEKEDLMRELIGGEREMLMPDWKRNARRIHERETELQLKEEEKNDRMLNEIGWIFGQVASLE